MARRYILRLHSRRRDTPTVLHSPLPLYCGTPSEYGSSMSGKKQIWYIEGSAAAALATPLRAQYDLHPIPQNKRSDSTRHPHSSDPAGIPAVWLADMKPSGEILHPKSLESANNCRVIGVFSA